MRESFPPQHNEDFQGDDASAEAALEELRRSTEPGATPLTPERKAQLMEIVSSSRSREYSSGTSSDSNSVEYPLPDYQTMLDRTKEDRDDSPIGTP